MTLKMYLKVCQNRSSSQFCQKAAQILFSEDLSEMRLDIRDADYFIKLLQRREEAIYEYSVVSKAI